MNTANTELITTFYEAFAAKDAEAMVACYHDDARFSDPVFTDLDADGVRNMWRMLIERGTDLAVTFSDVAASDRIATAHWDATYTFSATGRPVQNSIDARFEIADGKILVHRDTFDLYAWTRMALGPMGTVLGWSPIVQNKVRRQAMTSLDKFAAKRAKVSGGRDPA